MVLKDTKRKLWICTQFSPEASVRNTVSVSDSVCHNKPMKSWFRQYPMLCAKRLSRVVKQSLYRHAMIPSCFKSVTIKAVPKKLCLSCFNDNQHITFKQSSIMECYEGQVKSHIQQQIHPSTQDLYLFILYTQLNVPQRRQSLSPPSPNPPGQKDKYERLF